MVLEGIGACFAGAGPIHEINRGPEFVESTVVGGRGRIFDNVYVPGWCICREYQRFLGDAHVRCVIAGGDIRDESGVVRARSAEVTRIAPGHDVREIPFRLEAGPQIAYWIDCSPGLDHPNGDILAHGFVGILVRALVVGAPYSLRLVQCPRALHDKGAAKEDAEGKYGGWW
jgi:hypothetical protein